MRFGRSSARKEKNVPQEKKDARARLVWTWTAIDADTKLIVSWYVGSRDAGSAHEFIQDLAGRLRHRVQLTTDGHKPYLSAVEDAFGADIDYAMLLKIYGADADPEKRYSPAVCLGCKVEDSDRLTGPEAHLHSATSSARTSRCACRCAGSPV